MTIDRKLDNQNKANAVFIEFAYAKLLAIEGSISVLHFPKEEQAAEFLTFGATIKPGQTI